VRTQRKVEKQKLMRNGVKTVVIDNMTKMQELVNSKIEITKSADEKNSKDRLKDSLQVYRGSIVELGKVLAELAIEKAEGNLLNAKLGLWGGIAVVEAKLKENRQI